MRWVIIIFTNNVVPGTCTLLCWHKQLNYSHYSDHMFVVV